MINYGRQTLVQSAITRYNTSPDLEYVQIINESPYILTCTFRGMGFMDIPSWHKEDVFVNQNYNGQLDILPQNITTGQASSQSSVVSVNGFAPGEIETPKSIALSRMVAPSGNTFRELFAGVTFGGTTHPTITIPNVVGKTAILDNIDSSWFAGANNVVLTLTVNAIVTGLEYDYYNPSSATVPGSLDHIPFGQGQGIPQAANTAITITCVTSASLDGASTGTADINVHYHYEVNF